jgi:hypothetical protein
MVHSIRRILLAERAASCLFNDNSLATTSCSVTILFLSFALASKIASPMAIDITELAKA